MNDPLPGHPLPASYWGGRVDERLEDHDEKLVDHNGRLVAVEKIVWRLGGKLAAWSIIGSLAGGALVSLAVYFVTAAAHG